MMKFTPEGEGYLVSDVAVPIETAKKIVAEYQASGRECSWAPDHHDRALAWIWLTPKHEVQS